MSVPSPICTVDLIATPVDVSANATHEIELANTTGANFWSIQCTSTDETTTAAQVNATLSINQVTKKATFTSTGVGTALIFTSTVGISGLGLDANGRQQAAYTTTFKVNVVAANGNRVLAVNETVEQSAPFGWNAVLNPQARAGVTVTLGGDVQVSGNTATVVSITGSGGVVVLNANTLQWNASDGSPALTQAQAANASIPQSITIAPQAPGAGASTTNTGTPGGLVVNIAAPVSTGVEAGVKFKRSGTTLLNLQPLVGNPSTFWAMYPGSLTPSATNFSIAGAYDGSNVSFNSSSVFGFDIGGSAIFTVASAGIAFAISGSYTIYQTAQSGDVATSNLTIASQAPFASATTNKAPGNIILAIPAPVAGGTNGYVQLQNAGATVGYMGTAQSGWNTIWFGSTAPTTSNYGVSGNGTNLNFNSSTGMSFGFGGGQYMSLSASKFGLFVPLGGTGGTFAFSVNSIAWAATMTLSAAQQQNPLVRISGTATGAATLALGNVAGFWLVDLAQLAGLSAVNTLTITSGTGSAVINAAPTTLSNLAIVVTDGANHIAVMQ